MVVAEATLLGFGVALGGGLLIGVERERRKGTGPARAMAGVRTFSLAAVAGAGAQALGQPLLVATGALLIVVLTAVAYLQQKSQDPGITTELALLVTYFIGVMAMVNPALAGGGAVVVALLLASRGVLHRFSVDTLSESELRDGLVFAAAALILLPLLPNQPTSWSLGVSPRRLWGLVVVFMALQAVGYIAIRAGGARVGLALSGLAAGFVSSTATTAALGARARRDPAALAGSVSGALFSSVATIVLLGIVVATVLPTALPAMTLPLALSVLAILAVAGLSLRWRSSGAAPAPLQGRAFNLLHAIGFAALITAYTMVTTLIGRYQGGAAAGTTAALAGAGDVHAAAASILSLLATEMITVATAEHLILIALSANTFSKLVAAFVAGGWAYGVRVGLGLCLMLVAAWLPVLVMA